MGPSAVMLRAERRAVTAGLLFLVLGPLSRSFVLPGRSENRARYVALGAKPKGFGDTEELAEKTPAETQAEMLGRAATLFASAEVEDTSSSLPKLTGPLRAPVAPATYEALTNIRLRVAPSVFADIQYQAEIAQGTVFRAVRAVEEDGVTFLKPEEEKYLGAWARMTGVVGEWAGKNVVKRIPGSRAIKIQVEQGKGRAPTAVMAISEVEQAEVVSKVEPKRQVDTRPGPDGEARVKAVLEDPKIKEIIKSAGLDPEVLKRNPEILQKIARSVFGDDVVA